MTTLQELACTYAVLILEDDEVPVTAEKITTILKAAHVDVEPYWPGLFAKSLNGVSVKSLITNLSSGVGSGPAPAAAAAEAAPDAQDAAPAKEEKKEEPKEESDDDMGFGLFD